MGCWNETCFLTRLPIFEGDQVKLLFAVPAPDGRKNTVHCSGWFMPASLAVTGEYDGYGGIEFCKLERPVLDVLSMAEFRIEPDTGQKDEYELPRMPDPGDKAGWQDMLTELSRAANQNRLAVRLPENRDSHGYAPVVPQMAHAWAWDMLAGAGARDIPDGWAGSVTFRLGTAGPLRAALRDLDSEKDALRAAAAIEEKADKPRIPENAARLLAGLMSSMDGLRLAFGPTSGSGSQDGVTEDWQVEFYKTLFCRAARMKYRYDEYPQAPFSAATAWDGNFLRADRNGYYEQAPDIPDTDGPDALGLALLEAGIGNLLSAMDEARDENGGGRDE